MAWARGVALVLAAVAVAANLFPARAAALAVAAVGAAGGVAAGAAVQLPAALVEAALLWTFTLVAVDLLRARGSGALLASLAVLTAVPIVATRRITPTEHPAAIFAPTGFARAVARRDPQGRYRTVDESTYRPASPLLTEGVRASPWGTELMRRRWQYHAQALWGRGTVFNVDVDRGDFSRVESLRQVSSFAASGPDGAPFFSTLALRFGVRFRDQEPMPGFRRFGGDAFMDWDENPEALPDIRLAERWKEEPDALSALRELPRLAPGELVLETGRVASGSARPGTLRIDERKPERLRLSVSTPDPTWLFVLRGYWSYRSVTIDGKPVEAAPAQLAFTAVPVPAGEHEIEWREEIPGLAVVALGTGALRHSRGRARDSASRPGQAQSVTDAPAPSSGRGRLRRLGPGLLFMVLVVAVYAVPLFARRNFSGRDLIRLQPSDGEVDPRRLRARPASGLDARDLGRAAADAQPQRRSALPGARAALAPPVSDVVQALSGPALDPVGPRHASRSCARPGARGRRRGSEP